LVIEGLIVRNGGLPDGLEPRFQVGPPTRPPAAGSGYSRAGAGLVMARQAISPGPFGVRIRGAVLREQMRLGGLTGAQLARQTGLSEATISNALAGRRLHPSTFRLIAAALAKVEVIPGAEALAAGETER
jgi:lambda repressor-like predicted transcriptional regulator